MLNLHCDHCSRNYKVSDDKQGLTTRCLCGKKLTVPVIPDVLPADYVDEIRCVQKPSNYKKTVSVLNSLARIGAAVMFVDAAVKGRMIISRDI